MNKAEIKVNFKLDNAGNPLKIEKNGLNHYKIQIRIEDADEDTFSTQYKLHNTYRDPIREVPEDNHGFLLETTSYGDYNIQANLRNRNTDNLEINLYEGLRNSHSSEQNKNIQQALLDIKKH